MQICTEQKNNKMNIIIFFIRFIIGFIAGSFMATGMIQGNFLYILIGIILMLFVLTNIEIER